MTSRGTPKCAFNYSHLLVLFFFNVIRSLGALAKLTKNDARVALYVNFIRPKNTFKAADIANAKKRLKTFLSKKEKKR